MGESASLRYDIRVYRDGIRALLTGVNGVVLGVSLALMAWGMIDSLIDADGDRPIGLLVIATPALYAGWVTLEIAWRAQRLTDLMARIVTGCLVAPLFVAVPGFMMHALAVALPPVREAIARAADANDDFHYYWSEGIGQQLLLVPLGGWVVGAAIALGVCLIVTLPVLSLRAPRVVAAGSRIEPGAQDSLNRSVPAVFCGLGAVILGIVLWVGGEGGSIGEFPDGVRELFAASRYGPPHADQWMWPLGVVLVVAGCASILVGVLLVGRRRS